MSTESNKLSVIIPALEEALANGDDELIRQIESDLAGIGKHALLIGKRTQRDFYQAALDEELFHKPPFGDYSDVQEAKISDCRSKISALTHRIAALEGKLENPPLTHPASEGLNCIVESNETITKARLLIASVITSLGNDSEHETEFTIELFPFRDNSIVLTKEFLEDLLSLIQEYKPE